MMVLTTLFGIRFLMIGDDFGNKPQQSVVDLHNLQKMTNLIPLIQPEENYKDMLLALLYKVSQVFCLRAGKKR
jgi:hypothetical protein